MDRLFRSFSQVDSSTTRRYGGTGLGLAVSKMLVELMGGNISVTSEVGKGAIFSFTIKAMVGQAPLPVHAHGPDPDLKGKRAMLVDDNSTNLKILAYQLTSWGMIPTAFTSAKEALRGLSAGEEFDVALVDYLMPDIDGISLAMQLRHEPGFGTRPLMLLSSAADTSLREGDLFDKVMLKPVKIFHLHNALRSVLCGRAQESVRSVADQHKLPAMVLAKKVLVAEDNALNQKVARLLFSRLGMNVDMADDGSMAVDMARRNGYDMIFMDVQMPNMDGIEATAAIRDGPLTTAQPRIVAMTADAAFTAKERLSASRMDDFIIKPVRLDELVRVLLRATCALGKDDVPSGNDPTHSSSYDITSLERFAEAIGGDMELARKLFTDFLKDAAERLSRIREAHARNDIKVVGREAHTLKSTAGMFYANIIAESMRSIDAMAKAGDIGPALDEVARAEAELVSIRDLHLEDGR
jgi:CheY-like chemotaxis protein/HPt (histidine-containing phosphotransfer) domain-containing protein